MRVREEVKLNFEDVLMEPKRSTLSSRRDVQMTRKFTFRNSGKVIDFCPIFASNMDGVGTFEVAKVFECRASNSARKVFQFVNNLVRSLQSHRA